MKRLMIVEDDKILLEELVRVYENHGFAVITISNFDKAADEILAIKPDLLVLDLGLPGISGFDILSVIRDQSLIPILVLTSNDSINTELMSFSLGAEEFLAKPVDTRRLIARSRKLLDIFEKFDDVITIKGLDLETSTNKLSYNNKFLILAQTEADIIKTLIEAYPDVVSKDELLLAGWNTPYIDENVLQVNLSRLRKKLSSLGLVGLIDNVRSVGYKINLEAI